MKNIKTYETHHGNLSTVIRVGGCNMRIRFISKDNIHGYYATTDVEIQNAIEQDGGYGNKFTLMEDTSVSCEAEPELNPVSEISSWQEAKELLRKSPYSVSARELSSPEKIERAAKEKGIMFPALKIE